MLEVAETFEGGEELVGRYLRVCSCLRRGQFDGYFEYLRGGVGGGGGGGFFEGCILMGRVGVMRGNAVRAFAAAQVRMGVEELAEYLWMGGEEVLGYLEGMGYGEVGQWRERWRGGEKVVMGLGKKAREVKEWVGGEGGMPSRVRERLGGKQEWEAVMEGDGTL